MHLEPIHFIAQLIHERSQLSHQPKRWSSLSPEDQKHYLDRAKAQFDIFVQGEMESRAAQNYTNEATLLRDLHLKYNDSKLDGKSFIDYLKTNPNH